MLQQPTQDEFQQLVETTLSNVLNEAELQMQRKLQAAGYVVTGELMSSLRKQTVVVGKELYAEFTLGFRGYGRFKDMRKVLFSKLPPIEAIEQYVQAVGLDKFKYVPGYLLGAKYRVLTIPDNRAINRIAWGIAIKLQERGIKTSKSKAFYNPTRGRLVYEVRDKVIETLLPVILSSMKKGIQDDE